jgi:hypothetical protein
MPLPESLENRFLEYLAVMLSRSAGCQECQQIFVPSGQFSKFLKQPKIAGGYVR